MKRAMPAELSLSAGKSI